MSSFVKVEKGLEGRKSTLSVFIALSKAFDCVDYVKLFDKFKYYGIIGMLLKWFRSFLNSRSQVVQFSDKFPEPIELKYEVLQGSILSPILFIIYVNDKWSFILLGRPIQYADDRILLFSKKSKPNLEQHTFVDLNSRVQYFNNLNLKVKASNNYRYVTVIESLIMWLGDTMIVKFDSTKCLDIHLD